MAEKLEDVGYWLPSEFLTDEDILMDNNKENNKFTFAASNSASLHCFPSKFPYDYASSLLSSPVESSAETESDEEDSLLHELTRQLTISGTTHKVATTPATHNHEVSSTAYLLLFSVLWMKCRGTELFCFFFSFFPLIFFLVFLEG